MGVYDGTWRSVLRMCCDALVAERGYGEVIVLSFSGPKQLPCGFHHEGMWQKLSLTVLTCLDHVAKLEGDPTFRHPLQCGILRGGEQVLQWLFGMGGDDHVFPLMDFVTSDSQVREQRESD